MFRLGGRLQADLRVQSGEKNAWITGAVLASFAGAVYLLVRPPLFNFDGYLHYLDALAPFRGDHVNPHHLLWYPAQVLLGNALALFGRPSSVAFQVFGVLAGCATLLFLYRLLRRTSQNTFLAATLVLFVTFSPNFWFMTLQNQTYAVVYLLIVLYLGAWSSEGGGPPSKLRLLAAGLTVSGAIFLHQAVVLLVPAGVLALLISSREPMRTRLLHGLVWAGSIMIVVLATYMAVARFANVRNFQGFRNWTTAYMRSQHPVEIRLPESVSKSAMGVVRTVSQVSELEQYLRSHFTPGTIYGMYGALALAGVLGAVLGLWRKRTRDRLRELAPNNLLFTVCLLSMVAWGLFVLAWEPSGCFWGVSFLFLIVCMSLLLRGATRKKTVLLSMPLLLLSGWNLYANRASDRDQSIVFPEPWLDAIQKQVGSKDILIVLDREWFSGMDYDLLLACLDADPQSPAIPILSDFVLNPGMQPWWSQKLQDEIDSTLADGGRAFVAKHVFAPTSYADLSRQTDPFSEYTRQEFVGIDAPRLRLQVERVFRNYRIVPSSLKIGSDPYWELKR
jgi:hypothetical protein